MNTNGVFKPLKIEEHEKGFQNKCEICLKVFKNEEILLEHSILHTGERPYSCRLCNKSYPLVKGLKVHMRLIHGPAYQEREHPDQCNVCGIKIDKLSRLIEHEISHTGELPYQCLICKETFSITQSLAVHMRKHAAAKIVNPLRMSRQEEEEGNASSSAENPSNDQRWSNNTAGATVTAGDNTAAVTGDSKYAHDTDVMRVKDDNKHDHHSSGMRVTDDYKYATDNKFSHNSAGMRVTDDDNNAHDPPRMRVNDDNKFEQSLGYNYSEQWKRGASPPTGHARF